MSKYVRMPLESEEFDFDVVTQQYKSSKIKKKKVKKDHDSSSLFSKKKTLSIKQKRKLKSQVREDWT